MRRLGATVRLAREVEEAEFKAMAFDEIVALWGREPWRMLDFCEATEKVIKRFRRAAVSPTGDLDG